jgi:hypothetical protein
LKSIKLNSQTGLELWRSSDNSRNINMAWEGITEDIKISSKGSPGHYCAEEALTMV